MDWIKQFTDMIFPLNRDQLDIEGAFLLKNQHLPKSIFKYREINDYSIRNLEENTIWLADPSSFNDPYDCAITADISRINELKSSEYLETFIKDKGSALGLSDEQKKKLVLNQDPFDELINIFISREPPEKREALRDAVTALLEKMREDIAVSNSSKIADSFKLCSFSEHNDSMLMWAHYASYHQGFCIEYDLEHISYSDYRRRFMYPVIYSDEVLDVTEHLMRGVEDKNFNNLYLSLAALIKAKDWKYEKEWRLVFGNGIFDTERAYNMGKPKTVYLGSKISQEDQDLLVEICSRKDIPVSKMEVRHNMYKLEPYAID